MHIKLFSCFVPSCILNPYEDNDHKVQSKDSAAAQTHLADAIVFIVVEKLYRDF